MIRAPGDRFLSAPLAITPYANEHWEFAWLSAAAYLETPEGKKDAAERPAESIPGDPFARLAASGWVPWGRFLDEDLLEQNTQTHLRVQVWEKREPSALAVTFGGTVFTSRADWRANLRWFIPGKRDEYTEIVQRFAPAFAKELNRRAESMGPERLSKLELFSTGHSLGGGLAQQFAYSLPLDCVKRVKKVYVFDPSPVTGFYSVDQKRRDENKKGLAIDRIYERGEILALLRSLMSLFNKPSVKNAAIRGVRYNLFRAWNPIAAHSIVEMAAKVDAARGS